MKFVIMASVHSIMVWSALTGCSEHEQRGMFPPAPPMSLQEAREIAYLQANFFQDPCFAPLMRASDGVNAEFGVLAFYEVRLPKSALISDRHEFSLYVQRADRLAYLVRTGGILGVREILGPVSIARCLQVATTKNS